MATEPSPTPRIAFVFSGMGPQWWGMGRRLAAEEPVFREALERCDAALRPVAGWSLLDELGRDEWTSRVGHPELAEVTNLALQVGLAALCEHLEVVPDAVLGHSAGEIAAAYVAGALDLEHSLLLAYHRSRLQALATGKGSMLAAAISRAEAEELLAGLDGAVELAAVNAPASVTLTGDERALEAVERDLRRRRVFARRLPVSLPYHSRHLDEIESELLESLAPLAPREERIPIVSPVTGDRVAGPRLGPGYWWLSVRRPVLFADGVGRALDDGCTLFLELGPHPVLVSSIRDCMAAREAPGRVLGTLRRQEDERAAVLRACAAASAAARTAA